MQKEPAFQYITYGANLQAAEIAQLLAHQLRRSSSGRVTPLCIWGTHGIGKRNWYKNLLPKMTVSWCTSLPRNLKKWAICWECPH